MPAYKIFGTGPIKVLALHSWFCDSSMYEPLLPYLDPSIFSFLFLDLRGYGVAKDFPGEYSFDEGVKDALSLLQSQSWKHFHLLGHSMGSLISQKIALEHAARVQSMIALSPLSTSGSIKSPELFALLEEAALHSDQHAFECIDFLHNRRCSPFIVESMVKKWKTISLPEARLSYLHSLSSTKISDKKQELPVLLLMGEENPESSENNFSKQYPHLTITSCKQAGHFLVQESPLHIASHITAFLQKVDLK